MLAPKWMLSPVEEKENGEVNGHVNSVQSANCGNQGGYSSGVDSRMIVRTEQNKRMTPESHWQDVRHIVFTAQSPASYQPGDVLTIYPQNAAQDVDELIRRMEWDHIAEKPIAFISKNSKSEGVSYKPLPPIKLQSQSATTFRQLLTNHLDFTSIPRRSFFSQIANFTSDQFHKDRLLDFTKLEYIDELYDYTTRPRRSILEVLQEFGSVKIPWQWAANILPELRGRQFSIASGGQSKQTSTGLARFELLVAIVRYKTVIKKIREGVCTRYLAALQPGTQIAVTLQRGGLGIKKEEARRPAIMIGPGTGVAPMRSLIWERLLWLKDAKARVGTRLDGHADEFAHTGKTLLIYGCRNKAADFFYSDEWESLRTQMPLEVHTAFSRDQQAKHYVQDVIRKHSSEICRLLREHGGTVYVCGSSGKMPKAVRAALADIFQQFCKMDLKEAERYVEQLEKEGRYKQETW